MTRSPWDREYARRPREYVWGTEPSPFARRVGALLEPGARVLDLGCGEGRDSVFFAERGFEVTGVDTSRAGLRKARRLARERGTRVRWLLGDMRRLAPDPLFDLVYSCGAIHYVPRGERPGLFARLRALTRPGGWHALSVFTDRRIYVEQDEIVDYFASGELRRAYAGWRIVALEERLISCAQDGVPHKHSVEQVMARAPGAGVGGVPGLGAGG